MQDKVFLRELKEEQIKKLKQRQEDKILEKENADFLIKLIQNAESKEDVLKLSALGMSLKRTGFHFDVRLEKSDRTIKYFVKNEKLSFEPLSEAESTKESDSKILDEKCGLQEKAQVDKAEAVEMRKQGEAEVSLVNATLEQKITHTLIIGDNYPALLNLLINYKRKVKVIYIDPPYGKDDLGEFAHTNYDNAITRDNLLSMLYPRLQLAKQLLCDDGVIFCSIDDRNQAYVKGLFDEVFGEGNFVGNLVWNSVSSVLKQSKHIRKEHEYILVYAKDRNSLVFSKLENTMKFENPDNDPKGEWFSSNAAAPDQNKDNNKFAIKLPNGDECIRNWKFSYKEFINGDVDLYFKGGNVPRLKIYKSNYNALSKIQASILSGFGSLTTAKEEVESVLGNKELFSTPKPVNLIKHLLKISTTNPGDYVDLQADSSYDNATTTGGGGNFAA